MWLLVMVCREGQPRRTPCDMQLQNDDLDFCSSVLVVCVMWLLRVGGRAVVIPRRGVRCKSVRGLLCIGV